MGVIDAGVDDGDDGAAVAGPLVPGFRGVDVGVGRAAGLASVVQSPEAREAGVVRGLLRMDAVVWLRVLTSGLAR